MDLAEFGILRYSLCAWFLASSTCLSVDTPKMLWRTSPPMLMRPLRDLEFFFRLDLVFPVETARELFLEFIWELLRSC